MIGREFNKGWFWKNLKRGLLTVSVVSNILILSYVGGALARRLGAIESRKPIAAKERAKYAKHEINWPKWSERIPVLSFEKIKKNAGVHPQARQFIAEAVKREYPLDWNFSLNYRPSDSAFFYLVELSIERCDCEGDPFRKTSLRLFYNPYEGQVFFLDILKDVPPTFASTDKRQEI